MRGATLLKESVALLGIKFNMQKRRDIKNFVSPGKNVLPPANFAVANINFSFVNKMRIYILLPQMFSISNIFILV